MILWELRIFEIKPLPGGWNLLLSYLFREKPSKETMYAFLLDYLAEAYSEVPFKLSVFGHSVTVKYDINVFSHADQFILRLVKQDISLTEPLRLESMLTHSNSSIREAVKSFKRGATILGVEDS